MDQTVLHLNESLFQAQESPFLENNSFKVSLFRFNSGVCAVRMQNSAGELVVLPYQGQQIWSARMNNRDLGMVSMFDQPYPTRDFLATFGGFLLHCGATAMGVPSSEDNHPLHGELPNAPYQNAQIIYGSDEKGTYIGITGAYRHTIAFNYNYLAQPIIKLYADSSIFSVSMTVTNLKASFMPLMYLVHANFRPIEGGRLVYSTFVDPQHMRVNADIPVSTETVSGYREFLQELKTHPEKHLVLSSDQIYDPEALILVDYLPCKDGWARSMQVHPDGSADIVRHHTTQLPRAQRWICRTVDQQALGFEPATAEGSGYHSEKKKGNVLTLGPREVFHCDLELGVLNPSETRKEELIAISAIH